MDSEELPKIEAGNLPEEILEMIFTFLPAGTLCNAILVSRYWHAIGTNQKLWTPFRVSRNKLSVNGLSQFTELQRFEDLKSLDLSGIAIHMENWTAILSDIQQLKCLEDLSLENAHLKEIDGVLLSHVVAGLVSVNLGSTDLSKEQWMAVLAAVPDSPSLLEMNLKLVALSRVPPDLVGRALAKLKSANLSGTWLSYFQMSSLVVHCLKSDNLVELCLQNVSLISVAVTHTDQLSRLISRLRKMDLSFARMTTDQRRGIIAESIKSKTLACLKMRHMNLGFVSAEVLAEAVARLRKVDLRLTRLNTEQCTEMCKHILTSSTIQELNLYGVNLSEMPMDLLSEAMSSLRSVNLGGSKLNPEQCISLLTQISQSRTLSKFNLQEVSLDQVPIELLGNVVCRMRQINLSWTNLSSQQSVGILTSCVKSSTLVDLVLAGVHLSEVPIEIRENASSRINIHTDRPDQWRGIGVLP